MSDLTQGFLLCIGWIMIVLIALDWATDEPQLSYHNYQSTIVWKEAP